jgi:hypothetical protein
MRCAVALCAVAVLALPACGAASADDPGTGPLVVVLFDVSQSTRDVRGGYLDAFERVLSDASERRGHVVADVIDENPLAHSTYPIDVAFEGCDPLTQNPLLCDAEVSTRREEATRAAGAIVERRPARAGTDVLGAIRLAERVFAAYPEASERSLVILSDMVARSPSLSLRRGFTDADVDPSIASLQARGLVPDLTDVHVYVVGAGVVSGQELPGTSLASIQRFWERFVAAAGGELRPERYGAALLRFP